jgi:hypothetical protein
MLLGSHLCDIKTPRERHQASNRSDRTPQVQPFFSTNTCTGAAGAAPVAGAVALSLHQPASAVWRAAPRPT